LWLREAARSRRDGNAMKKTVKSMVDEAMDAITTYSIEEARDLHGMDDVQFVDLRDVRELERDGVIPGAFHAPRGMLEFWADPESPYHKPVFASGRKLVLFCAAGWRSALATKTLQDMGFDNVGHIGGGFGAWKQAGAPVAEKASKAKPSPAGGDRR
jgi:rhodanese-related sulfurtransferase